MKYLSPVKHLYRVAYADPTEHMKRAKNMKVSYKQNQSQTHDNECDADHVKFIITKTYRNRRILHYLVYNNQTR